MELSVRSKEIERSKHITKAHSNSKKYFQKHIQVRSLAISFRIHNIQMRVAVNPRKTTFKALDMRRLDFAAKSIQKSKY